MNRDKNGQFIKGHKGYKFWLNKKRGPQKESSKLKTSLAMRGVKKTKEHKKNISLSKKGNKNPSWNGGRHKESHGYWVISKPGHPFANCNGLVFEHRLVAEKHLGRYLTKEEVVHHIDFDPENNDWNNLYISNRSKHSKLHREINKIIIKLLKQGIVSFNRERGIYEQN